MQLYELKSIHKKKQKKRVGRGGKRGTYSGRGIKGQKSRSGRRLRPAVRDWIKRYPKLRGYRFNRIKPKPATVSLGDLESQFNENEVVSPKALMEKKLVRKIKGRMPAVKILGGGELKKTLTFENCDFSKSAKEAVEKAKGKIK